MIESLALPKAFLHELLLHIKLDGQKRISELTKKERILLLDALTAFSLKEFKVIGFERAMATCGGLSLDEVSMKTFKVKAYSKLYAVGEVLDIDGDTGGYNIQAAFSMGYCAAKQIIKEA